MTQLTGNPPPGASLSAGFIAGASLSSGFIAGAPSAAAAAAATTSPAAVAALPQFTTECEDSTCNAKRHELVAVTTILILFSSAAFALRMVSRYLVRSAFALDDWLVLLALLTSIGISAALLNDFTYGFGASDVQVGPFNIRALLQGEFAIEILWITANTSAKFSLLFFYCRLFSIHKLRIGCYITAAFIALDYIADILVSMFQCMPANFFWNRALTVIDPSITGSCRINIKAFLAAGSAITLVTDLIVFLLPVPVIWQLKIGLKTKIGLTFAFTISVFVCTCSIVRLSMLDTFAPTDIAAASVTTSLWACAEASGGTIAACVPTFTPIVLRLLGRRVAPSLTADDEYDFESKDVRDGKGTVLSREDSMSQMENSSEDVEHKGGGWGRRVASRVGLKRHGWGHGSEDDEHPLRSVANGGIMVTSEMQQTTEFTNKRLTLGGPAFEVSASKVPIVWHGITERSDWS